MKFLRIIFILCCIPLLSSFGGDLDDIQTFNKKYSHIEFYTDAYNFKLKNNIIIPNHYYQILNIKNPNIVPATSIPVLVERKIEKPIPFWILKGILKTETRSYYRADGSIKYVDKRRGNGCSIGAFQMKRIAFDQVKKSGECFWDIETNTKFAEEMAIRYLLYLYNNCADKSWNKTIIMYNLGPSGYDSSYTKYLNSVKEKGKL